MTKKLSLPEIRCFREYPDAPASSKRKLKAPR